MNLLLTPELLNFLKKQGFKYCLFSSTAEHRSERMIVLTPVKLLPEHFGTFYDLNNELDRMADGLEDVLVLIQLDKTLIANYISFLLPEKPEKNVAQHDRFYVIKAAKE